MKNKKVFINSHFYGFNAGESKSKVEIAEIFKALIDENPNIKAIFTGHDHVFSAFKYKNCFNFVVGTASYIFMRKPWWSGEIHGKLTETFGGEYHLDSYQKHGYLEVEFFDSKIVYKFVSLEIFGNG